MGIIQNTDEKGNSGMIVLEWEKGVGLGVKKEGLTSVEQACFIWGGSWVAASVSGCRYVPGRLCRSPLITPFLTVKQEASASPGPGRWFVFFKVVAFTSLTILMMMVVVMKN